MLRLSHPLLRCLFSLGVAAALASCQTARFYAQAAKGQWEILHKARPIPQVLQDCQTQAPLKRQLELVQELRAFTACELHLPADKQFKDYTDLGREHVVWVVFAAPEFSVEAKTWWYPLVGNLKYRGFFNAVSAKAEGSKLKAQGCDVFVGGTDAYSSLGWFADPVLNTFLRRSDAELAELIFHELTHARLFISGDTDFNEALATAVGQAGVRQWLRSRGKLRVLARYEQQLTQEREVIRLLLDTRTELAAIYAIPRPTEAQRTAKAAVFEQMRQRYAQLKRHWPGSTRYDRFFASPMNNAQLNTVATYYDLVPEFERLLRYCSGDVDAFLAQVSTLKSTSPKRRRAALAHLP